MRLLLLAFLASILVGQQQVFTDTQATAGKASYQASCAKCHTDTLVGRDGTGDIPEFVRVYGGKIPPLAGANAAFPPFLKKWSPQTTQDLTFRVKEATRGFPPPDGRLSEDLYLNLTAYILQSNGARPGTAALTMTTASEIRLVVSK